MSSAATARRLGFVAPVIRQREQALAEQVERGAAEDHRHADRVGRLVRRGDQQIAGDRGRDDARDDRQMRVGVGVAREATGVVAAC